ncbi:Uncharacterised protein [Budvicia aquatica]|uniref:Uncharacterized protein n=1 Tax=Budvicia aquatica TaxID=82979 RepID=A0A484ZD95_9GAMM|nr:Uncharacterised protein [Budvicia aquatica]
MLTDHPTKKKMSLSVLSIALISCFPFATVQAVPTPVSTPPFFLAASNTEEIGYTFWMVQKHYRRLQ